MKRWVSRLTVGIALLALLSLLGSSGSDSVPPPAQGPVLLWEPTWSPITVQACLKNLWEDRPSAVFVWDMQGDGRPDLLVKGAILHSFTGFDFSPMPASGAGRGVVFYNDASVPGGIREVTTAFPGQPTAVTLYPRGVSPSELDSFWDGVGLWYVLPADLDKNAATDLIILGDEGIWPALNPGSEPSWHPFWEVAPVEGAPFAERTAHTFRMWVGDLTWDGIPDVLFGDNQDAALYISQGAENGEFAPLARIAIEGCPVDIVWSREGAWIQTSTGLWLFPRGRSEVVLRSQLTGFALAVDDMDDDGTDEVAVGTWTGLVLLRQGVDGELVEIARFSGCGQVSWLAAGDINGDGYADLAIGSSSGAGMWTLFGASALVLQDLHWQGIATESDLPVKPRDGLLSDLDGDGRDEFVALVAPSSLVVMSPSPCGRSVQQLPGAALLGAGDANGDGLADLLGDDQDGGVSLLRNAGGAWFEAERLVPPIGAGAEGATPFAAAWIDIDGDGANELAEWCISDVGGLLLLWSQGGDTWVEEWRFALDGSPLPPIRTGDVDGDGLPEVVVAAGDSVAMLGGRGTTVGGPTDVLKVELGGEASLLEVVRNLDGCDVVALRIAGEDAQWVRVAPDGVTELPLSLDMSPLSSAAADVDGDGAQELVLAGVGAISVEGTAQVVGFTSVIRVRGTDVEHLRTTPVDGWTWGAFPFPQLGIACGDFNGDARQDIAVLELPTKYSTGRIAMVDGKTGAAFRWCERVRGYCLTAIDANRDGVDDAAWVATGTRLGLGLVLGERP